ncbi:hypothetical protein ACFQ0B_01975 [Nonomuraea thailandensis]
MDGELRVGHDPEDLRPGRTLQSLYLDPLAERVRHGSVYPRSRQQLQLLVDIKNNGAATYTELDRVLKSYRKMLTGYHKGRVKPGAVTVVISGDRPRDLMAAQERRYAFYDGRMADLGQGDPALIPLISDNWTNHFTWTGVGEMPAAERDKLRQIVATAHRDGQRVRFWATPDTAGPARDALWRELVAADVDHINTDDLAGLEAFLRADDGRREAADPSRPPRTPVGSGTRLAAGLRYDFRNPPVQRYFRSSCLHSPASRRPPGSRWRPTPT